MSPGPAVEAPRLDDCFGTHRPQQPATPRQRRAARWVAAVTLALLVGWLAVLLSRGRLGAALGILAYVVTVTVLGPLVGRRLGPQTRLGPAGITVSTGLTGGRRSVRWEQVASLDVPQRFETHHAAVLTDGDRIELPGLPPGVIERLRAELGATPARATPPPPPPALAADAADDGWDGPFHRG